MQHADEEGKEQVQGHTNRTDADLHQHETTAEQPSFREYVWIWNSTKTLMLWQQSKLTTGILAHTK